MQGKNSISTIALLLTAVIFLQLSCKKKETKKTVGETYQGGKVFFVDNTGLHGLVAATADISNGSPWGCVNIGLSGADGTGNGTGNQNTSDIVKGCAESGTAARLCSDLTSGGFSDWYLPSKDELSLMYQQKDVIGGFSTDIYWSSSESSIYAAWVQSFGAGTQFSTTSKDYGASVRPIRSF